MKTILINGIEFKYGELNPLQFAAIVELIGKSTQESGRVNVLSYIGKDMPDILDIYLKTDSVLPCAKKEFICENMNALQIEEVMTDFFTQSDVFGIMERLVGTLTAKH